ncbi:hypothetical protein COM13_23270, partial [Bacillus pseudomycoides]
EFLAPEPEMATQSAIMNQSQLEKRTLNHFFQLSYEYDALGGVVAHGGTYIGLLLWQEEKYNDKLSTLRGILQKEYGQVHIYHTLFNGKCKD